MDSASFGFLAEGRFDRFDTLHHQEFDRWQHTYRKWAEQAEYTAAENETGKSWNSRCLGADDATGKRLYSFETWGRFSEAWAQTVNPAEYDNLQRLDYRIEADIDTSKLPGFAHHVESNGRFGRNVSTFSSREREKKEGRHAGGKGCSIGSHKSDRRLVIYRRKGESGAIELQLSGQTLRRMVQAAKSAVEANLELSMYRAMRGQMQAALEKMARESGFESAYALVQSMTAEAPTYEPPADFVAEAPVQMLLQGFGSLPADQKRDALRQMNALYLGDEPARA